jgi:exocyst complex component 1
MADQDSVRQRIITSVFSKIGSSGYEESYVAHIKIWEDTGDGSGRKPRYILISRAFLCIKQWQAA